MLPIRPNYLQRPVQEPPKFKTFQMDKKVKYRSSESATNVPTSLVTIPNFKWPADRWRTSPGNARQKFYHGGSTWENRIPNTCRPLTSERQQRYRDEDTITQDAKKIEYMNNYSTAANSRPVTTDKMVRSNIDDNTVDEESIRVNTALPQRRRMLVSRQGYNPDKLIMVSQLDRSVGRVDRFIVRRHSLAKLHEKQEKKQNRQFISDTGDTIHSGLTKTLPAIRERRR